MYLRANKTFILLKCYCILLTCSEISMVANYLIKAKLLKFILIKVFTIRLLEI